MICEDCGLSNLLCFYDLLSFYDVMISNRVHQEGLFSHLWFIKDFPVHYLLLLTQQNIQFNILTSHVLTSYWTFLGVTSSLSTFAFIGVSEGEGASLIVQLVKNLPVVQETPVQFLGSGDLLEKG